MRGSDSTSTICPLFSGYEVEILDPLEYISKGSIAGFLFSFYLRDFRFKMTFYELLVDDDTRYYRDEPCEDGYLYSHPGQQQRKKYRKACIGVSFPIQQLYIIFCPPLTPKLDGITTYTR
jgi:hypothetical protein